MDKTSRTHQFFLRLTLVIGVILTLIKFIAWYITNSNAILSDAFESILNLGTGGFALYSLYLSQLPKDRNHPYGHGKIEFLAAGIAGGFILITGLFIIGKAFYNFFEPNEIINLNTGIYLTVFSGSIHLVLGLFLLRRGKRHNNLVLESEAKHLLSDGFSSIALIVGLVLILLTGFFWLDQVVAIGLGIFIIYSGFGLLRKAIAGIMDEADLNLIEEIISRLNNSRHSEWIDLHNFRVIKYGSKLHIDCHLTIPWYYNQIEGHHVISDFENAVDSYCGDSVELFIHVDPCEPPEMCRFCSMEDCQDRKFPMKNTIDWNVENVITNKKIYLQQQ
ncbi:MAG: cation transporter [Saprospirales bacterium]|nr:MAG: cation transporter [Saprospirales bacterium]